MKAAAPISIAEEWRPVTGYEGLYEVSDLGRVKSLVRVVNGKEKCERILKCNRARSDYRRVGLLKDGVIKLHAVHSLVLKAFDGPRPDGMVCRHLDGTPSNNSIENLRWGTPLENSQDMIRHRRERARRTYASRHPEIVEVLYHIAFKEPRMRLATTTTFDADGTATTRLAPNYSQQPACSCCSVVLGDRPADADVHPDLEGLFCGRCEMETQVAEGELLAATDSL